MMTEGVLGLLTAEDVASAVVHAVTQPRHVLIDTIEIQPAVPQRSTS
jgi:NADP-dependent 3-hydroxy acid dehydrogenase YdfG